LKILPLLLAPIFNESGATTPSDGRVSFAATEISIKIAKPNRRMERVRTIILCW